MRALAILLIFAYMKIAYRYTNIPTINEGMVVKMWPRMQTWHQAIRNRRLHPEILS